MNKKSSHNTNCKTICIVQITRFGDLLQTAKAAAALKSEKPEIRLVLIAREKFGTSLDFILNNVFDNTILLDPKKILNNNQTINEQAKNLDPILATINSENISALVNLSFSKTSSYLCSLISADHKLGPHYDDQANLIIKDKWSQFVYSNVMGGPLNPYNLVDIFKLILGCKEAFIQSVPTTKSNSIIIHPFASLTKKRWKSHKWCDVIYKILRDNPNTTVHLVGSDEDYSDASKIVSNPILNSYQKRIFNSAGKNTIYELSNIIQQSSLFIGHDSMVSHLASFYNIPILSIPLGCVRPIETAPYGTNTYVLAPKIKCFPCFPDTKCEHHQCHSDIPYQVISSSAQQLLDHGKITKDELFKQNSHFNLNSTNVLFGRFSNIGMFHLFNITEDEHSFKELIKVFYRISWLYLLAEVEEHTDFPIITPVLHQQLLAHMPGLQHIFELFEFGKKYCRFILEEISSDSPEVGQIKEYSQKIDDIDNLLKELKSTFPALSPIIDFHSIAKGSILGDNIVELTQQSFSNYNDSSCLVSVMYELIEKSITEHKHISTNQRSI